MPEVKVYRNLKHGRNAPPLYSVVEHGRVVDRVPRIMLSNARFVVRESGRQKVLQQKRKNVHAFVIGNRKQGYGASLPVPISYNPYVAPHFYAYGNKDKKVSHAKLVLLNEFGMSGEEVSE